MSGIYSANGSVLRGDPILIQCITIKDPTTSPLNMQIMFLSHYYHSLDMSFFDEPKNAGTLLLIIALLNIILSVIVVFAIKPYKDMELWKQIIMLVGSVLVAAIYAILGLDIQKGECRFKIGEFFNDVKSKFGVLLAITATAGIVDIISGISTAFGSPASGIYSIVVGILLIVMAYIMVTGNKEANQVVWVILLILYILMLIGSIIACLALIGIPMLLLSIILITFLISPEVKSKMGM